MQREDEINEVEDLSEEEEPHRQRFDIVIMWSTGTEERISPGEVEALLREAVTSTDEKATIEVTEIPEPTF